MKVRINTLVYGENAEEHISKLVYDTEAAQCEFFMVNEVEKVGVYYKPNRGHFVHVENGGQNIIFPIGFYSAEIIKSVLKSGKAVRFIYDNGVLSTHTDEHKNGSLDVYVCPRFAAVV